MSAKLLFLLLGFLLGSFLPSSSAESPTCLAVYKEGGAPAVFRSRKCPRWTLLADDLASSPPCDVAVHQGRRRSQEDRAVCALDMRIPFLGKTGVEQISVGLIGVFDGHNGDEASDMASKLLLEYFFLHVYFILDRIYSAALKRSAEGFTYNGVQNLILDELNVDEKQRSQNTGTGRSKWMSPLVFDRSFHMLILKESLLRAVHDIDAAFSQETLAKDLESGSTATIVLILDGQILISNIGDSKAILCSESLDPYGWKGNASKLKPRKRHGIRSSVDKHGNFESANLNGLRYLVKELTEDHHPSRDDEKKRVEDAGGYVAEWAGVFRVNGELAITRAIGDIRFKSYGVISKPEVTDWLALTSNDSYLVAASDGVFEKMNTQEVCDLLWDRKTRLERNSEIIPTIYSPAEYIVKTALGKGTMDNMATVVVPLASNAICRLFLKDGCDLEGNLEPSSHGLEKVIHKKSANEALGASLIPIGYTKHMMSRFDQLLVESKYRSRGCFYLSESLDETMDFIFQGPVVYAHAEAYDLPLTSAEPLEVCQNVYFEQGLESLVEAQNGYKGQCTSPEVFVTLLGLLDSIPYTETMPNSSEPFHHKAPHFRYILKRRFDRGSYGEVWLAYHWNCSHDVDGSNHMHKNQFHFSSTFHLDQYACNASKEPCFNDPRGDDNLFILKRIMVERGTAAYLSGLREKYFGEVFLNASLVLGSSAAGFSTTKSLRSQFGFSNSLKMNMSWANNMEYILDPTIKCSVFDKGPSFIVEEGLEHIARFMESFESESKEIWLVFKNEGLSLSKLIYTAESAKFATDDEQNQQTRNIQVVHPSAWWQWLRTTEAGAKEFQNIIWQLLIALKACHDRNITHRDIKPENMIVCFEELDTGRCLREVPSRGKQYHLKMRIIDFGSAIDDFTMSRLYGSGPTRSEQTFEYTPPEALLNSNWFRGPKSLRLKYDLWSVGVVILELILGSPHVFQISDRTRALLDQHLEGWSEHTKELAYKLRSFMEMCILIPGTSSQNTQNKAEDHRKGGVWPASWKCSEESFAYQVRSRDPLGLGFPNVWALRLVRQLLVWHPEDRLSIDDALHHPFFQSHNRRRDCGKS